MEMMPRRRRHASSSSEYYEEDIIISDENNEQDNNYDMQAMYNFSQRGNNSAGLMIDDDDDDDVNNNDEVASAASVQQNNGRRYYEGDEYCNNNEEDHVQFLDEEDDERDYQSHTDVDSFHDIDEGRRGTQNKSANADDGEEENDNGYYHDYPNDEEEHYQPLFDIGNLQQLPYPPSLDFGCDDNNNRYEADDDDDECHFDDFIQQIGEEQNGDEHYEQRQVQSDLPQLSAQSLDVVHRIEVLMESIVATLDKMEAPQISGYKEPATNNDDDDDSSYEEEARDNAIVSSNLNVNGDQNFNRAWGNIGQCRTFTSICLVLSFIHQLLLSMRTTTTREVYYVFVTHFRSQRECDSAILDVAKILGVSRRSLGLSASPKGWFCGCVEITRRGTLPSGKDVSGTIDGTALSSIQGLPITREWIERDEEGLNEQGVEISVTSKDAKCILVIEKEGVFNRLSEERLYDRFPCIMVTGKGFPDLATRALVKTLHDELDLPVLGLCDMNPYGISVLSVYFCAGDRMGVDGNYRYSVPIEWMGLRPTEVSELHEKHRFPDTVFQALTDLDRKRIDSLTDETSPYLDEDEKDEVAEEMKYKVELEALYWLGANFLGNWVFNKLQSRYE